MSGGANLLTAVLVGVQLAAFERPAALTIPRGTDVPVTLDENVTLKRDQVGSIFPAHITRDILVAGVVANRAGAPAQVVLVEGEDTPGAASFHLLSVSIRGDMRPIRTDVARADAVGSRSDVGKKAGIGAIAGGAVGLLLGGGGGLLKGAVVGAGGGLAWGLLDHGSQRVEIDTPLVFGLREPVRVE